MAIPGNAKHLSSPKGAMALKAETQHPASKFALETDFRGDVRVMHWDTKDASSLQSHAEFARAIAGAYDLPPAWSATLITYTSPCVRHVLHLVAPHYGLAHPAACTPLPDVAWVYLVARRKGERCALLNDEHLQQALQLGQASQAAGTLLRIRIERVGVALTESMQSVPRNSQKKRLSPKGALNAGPGGLPTYTNRKGERVLMHHSVKSVASNVNSSLATWTALRPGTDGWLNWQRNVKKTLTVTPELQQHAKYIVPPRAQKGDHAYVLLPSAGCFYYFPFVSDGRRYALLGRPRCASGTVEQQVPPELLVVLKKLAPEVCTPENELAARKRQQEIDEQRAEYMAKVSSAGPGPVEHTQEEILARRKELMAKEQERQQKDWCRQVQAMRSHTSFSTLLPGGSMIAAMDVTLLVVDDAQCLLASRHRLDSPSEQEVQTPMDIRSLLADITVVSAFDVLATMQLQADNERAYARQQALLKEIEEENELKTASKTTKQAKNRKKKNRKQQKNSPKENTDPVSEVGMSKSARALLVEVDDGDAEQLTLASLTVPSGNLSDSTDGTDDGLTHELERAITAADEDELYRNAGPDNGWTVVASPTRPKPVAAEPQSKKKKQQQARRKGAAKGSTVASSPGAVKEAQAGPATKASGRKAGQRRQNQEQLKSASTPERKTAAEVKVEAVSPAVAPPSSPATTVSEAHKAAENIGEADWPQLKVSTQQQDDPAGVEPIEEDEEHAAAAAEGTAQSAEAAQQIESMMTGLAVEDEVAVPTELAHQASVSQKTTGWVLDSNDTGEQQVPVETDPAADEVQRVPLQPAGGAPALPGLPQHAWGYDAPYGDEAASNFVPSPSEVPATALPSDLNQPMVPAPAPEGMHNYTVAFTVQGSGTICISAPSGQDAIEQLQYNTSLHGGLAELLSYAKCATMFQIVSEDGPATE
jgi:hypothetical protein